MKLGLLQSFVTTGALVIAIVHTVRPDLSIDGITLAFIIVAILPWSGTIFKSLEFPGGWKIEYQDLQNATEKVDKAGLLPASIQGSSQPHSFQIIADQDPNLALAGLRIEIEKRLLDLADANAVSVQPRASVSSLLRLLAAKNILSTEESSVLADMIGLLNSAVHGATVDAKAADWALEVGPRLLQGLDTRAEVKY